MDPTSNWRSTTALCDTGPEVTPAPGNVPFHFGAKHTPNQTIYRGTVPLALKCIVRDNNSPHFKEMKMLIFILWETWVTPTRRRSPWQERVTHETASPSDFRCYSGCVHKRRAKATNHRAVHKWTRKVAKPSATRQPSAYRPEVTRASSCQWTCLAAAAIQVATTGFWGDQTSPLQAGRPGDAIDTLGMAGTIQPPAAGNPVAGMAAGSADTSEQPLPPSRSPRPGTSSSPKLCSNRVLMGQPG